MGKTPIFLLGHMEIVFHTIISHILYGNEGHTSLARRPSLPMAAALKEETKVEYGGVIFMMQWMVVSQVCYGKDLSRHAIPKVETEVLLITELFRKRGV